MIANEFGEAASDPLHRAALIAAGLVLFVLTLVVNGVARYFVIRAERAQRRAGVPEGDGRMSARSAPRAARHRRSRRAPAHRPRHARRPAGAAR